jgi:hypothetical protein
VTQLIEFPLASGGSVLIQVSERARGPVTRGLASTEVTERAHETFEQAISHVQPAVEGVMTQLRSLAEAPALGGANVTQLIEFGLNLHVEAGAFIASASTSANFVVSLTWRRATNR